MEEKEVNEPLDINQTELEKDFEEEIKQENIEIVDLASYVANVKGVSAQTKQDIENLIELLKEAPKVGAAVAVKMGQDVAKEVGKQATAIKKQFVDGVANIERDIKEIDDYEFVSDMEVYKKASKEKREIEELSEVKKTEGKFSDRVADTVKDVKSNSKDMRTKVASGAIKVAGFVGKGMALFGKKGLAKDMIDKVTKYGESFVEKESRIANLMEKGAEVGFAVVGGTKQFGKDAKQFIEDKAEDAKKFGINAKNNVIKTAKDGAILLGKATYAPIGIGIGIAEYTIDTVNDKLVQPGINLAKDVKENVIEPNIEKVEKKAEQTKTYGSELWKLAKAKVDQVKSMPTNLRGRMESLLISVATKIAPTIEDKNVAKDRNAVVAQKSQDARAAFNTLTGKETKQNSDSGER